MGLPEAMVNTSSLRCTRGLARAEIDKLGSCGRADKKDVVLISSRFAVQQYIITNNQQARTLVLACMKQQILTSSFR
eukprot:scaffold2556_cov151-Skeletonema_marinoi.AAC.2